LPISERGRGQALNSALVVGWTKGTIIKFNNHAKPNFCRWDPMLNQCRVVALTQVNANLVMLWYLLYLKFAALVLTLLLCTFTISLIRLVFCIVFIFCKFDRMTIF